MKQYFKRFCLFCWHGAASTLVALALLLVLAQVLLPLAGGYRENFANLVGDFLGTPVHVESFSLTWEGYGPLLRIDGLTLLDAQSGRAQARVQTGLLRLGFARPLWRLQYRVRELSLVGVPLILVRESGAGIRLAGFGQPLAENEAQAESPGTPDYGWVLALLEADRLRLRDAVVELRDIDGSRHRLSGLNIAVDNNGLRHQIALRATLPDQSGASINLLADFAGPERQIERWTGDLFVGLRDIDLNGLAPLLEGMQLPLSLPRGRASLLLWSSWSGLQPHSMEAELTLESLHADGRVADSPLARVDALFRGQRTRQGWLIDSHRLQLLDGTGEPWALRRLQLEPAAETDGGAWRLLADDLEIERLLATYAHWRPDQAGVGRLNELAPGGHLRRGWLEFGGANGMAAGADLSGFRLAGKDAVPAVTGLDAGLEWRSGELLADLRGEQVSLDFKRLFREPLNFSRLQGRAALRFDESGVELHSERLLAETRHARAESRLRLALPAGGPAFLDLQTRFGAFELADAPPYLPVGIMYPPLVTWLDSALPRGRVGGGQVLVHGPLDRFPFRGQEGVFDIEFDFADATLAFNPAWPDLEQLDGNARFRAAGLSVRAAGGAMLNGRLKSARSRIEDFRHPVVEVEADAEAALEDYLQLVRASPLQSILGGVLHDAVGQGDAPLALRLRLPLFGETPVTLEGHLEFDGDDLDLRGLGVDLQDMQGRLAFSESGVSIQRAHAVARGSPAVISAESVTTDSGRLTRVLAEGRYTARQLLPESGLPLETWLPGHSDWRVQVEVPMDRQGGELARITASSELIGTALALPAPLTKPAGEPRRLEVSTALHADGMQLVDLALAGRGRARLELRSDERSTWIQRAAVNYGENPPRLPAEGIALTGRPDFVDLREWLDFSESVPAGDGEQPALPRRLSQIDLVIDEFLFDGLRLDAASISGRAMETHLSLMVDARQAAGQVAWPFKPLRHPVRANMQRFDLSAALDETDRGRQGPPADPRQLPEVEARFALLSWRDAVFADLEVVAERRFDGLHLTRLRFGNEQTLAMSGSGHWVSYSRPPHGQSVQRAMVDFQMHSEDLGAGFRSLGYADTLREGSGDFDVHLAWYGSLLQPDLSRLTGRVVLDFEDGRAISVDPGMGRVFGLFSLQALPRRLSLDFADVVTDGFSYDRIDGEFRILGGQAWTDNLVMSGPAATVRSTGRTGLVDRDYDQRVEVRPHLVSSLPLVSAIAAGPATGLAVLIVERTFSGLGLAVEDIGKVTYTLRGSWDQPRIEQVFKKQEEQPSFSESSNR